MSGEFTIEVEQMYPVAVIRPRGVLDAYTAPDLRTGLLDCLAEQPSGVMVDASALEIADDVALTVIGNVAQQSERWPGARLAVAGAGPEIAAAAERLGVARSVPFYPDRRSAMQEIASWPRPPSRRDRITPNRNAPGLARVAVVEFCEALGVGGDGDAAQLVASELVTNAVVHAGTDIDLTLRLIMPSLHIAVRDGGDGRAKIKGVVDESSETGRGLLLVDALAARWGSFVPKSGKVVWAVVRVRRVGEPWRDRL
jgi:anti-anti-sigma regulatory factor